MARFDLTSVEPSPRLLAWREVATALVTWLRVHAPDAHMAERGAQLHAIIEFLANDGRAPDEWASREGFEALGLVVLQVLSSWQGRVWVSYEGDWPPTWQAVHRLAADRLP